MIVTCGPVLLALTFAGVGAYAPEDASREERFANPPTSARLLPIHHYRPDDRMRPRPKSTN